MSDAREDAKIPAERRSGHGTDDADDRRQQRTASVPESNDTEVTRTPRGESPTEGDGTSKSRSGSSSESGSRTTIPGNTSETGAGSPVADSTGNRAPRSVPGMAPMGCGKSAAGMMLFIVAVTAAISQIAKR